MRSTSQYGRVGPYVASLAVVAALVAAILGYATLARGDVTPRNALLVLAFTLLLAAALRWGAIVVSRATPEGPQRSMLALDDAVYFLALLVLPPFLAPFAVLLSSFVDQILTRRIVIKWIFNTASSFIAAVVSAFAYAALVPTPTPVWLAASIALLAYPLVIEWNMAGILSRLEGRSRGAVLRDFLLPSLTTTYLPSVVLGVTILALWSLQPASLFVLVPALLSARFLLLQRERAERERRAHASLAQLARSTASSDHEIAAAIIDACHFVLDAGEARLELDAPTPARWERVSEGGPHPRFPPIDAPLRLGATTGRLVVARDRVASAPYTDHDQGLLGLIATSAAAALQAGRTRAAEKARAARQSALSELRRAVVLDPDPRRALAAAARAIAAGLGLPARAWDLREGHEVPVAAAPEGSPAIDRAPRPGLMQLAVGATELPEAILALESGSRAINDEEHEFLREVVFTLQTIFERARSERALREADKLSALGTLVAGIAHEINNPLTYMQGSAELVLLTLDELAASPELDTQTRAALERSRGDMDHVLKGALRIATITSGLKRVARKPTGERKAEDVNALVGSVCVVAAPRVGSRTTLTTALEATTPAFIDAGEISQVLLNLLFNAADATASLPSARITIRSSSRGPRVIVEVEDTGPGIPLDAQEKLFTPFFTTKAAGTGLGLSISRSIVEAHGGSLTFSSAPEKGTTFRIELPAASPAEPRKKETAKH